MFVKVNLKLVIITDINEQNTRIYDLYKSSYLYCYQNGFDDKNFFIYFPSNCYANAVRVSFNQKLFAKQLIYKHCLLSAYS